MSMTILLETDGGISEFAMKPIDRKSRQRTTKKLAVDSLGRDCSRALLTYDGLVLHSGSVAQLYEDSDGNSVQHGDVLQTDEMGATLRNLATTVGRQQRPVGPVMADELLEHTVLKAYGLLPTVIARDLRDSLANGDIYRVAFRPRASVVDNPAFLFSNHSGVFLLQCRPCLVEFVRLDQPIVLDDEIDVEEDQWDDWQMNVGPGDAGGDTW